MSYRDLSISKKITIPAILIFIVGLLIVIVNMRQLRSNTLELVGVKTAESVANEIIAVRGFYTKEIVKKGKNNNMKFRTDFAEHSDVFPLPATLVNSLGKSIAEQFPGMSIKLYSNYPFSHKERPVLDDFQKESLAALESKPDIPVWSIGMFNNRYSIRYVVPDIMKAGCVGCHNSHPNSIKRDWKAGDVRGAVEVVVPLDNVNSVLFTGFAKVFIIVVVIFAALVAVILYLIRKYVTVQVSVLSHNINAVADGNLNIQGAVTSTDEIGQVAAVFNKMTYMFRDVVNEIHSTSEQLDRSSNELTTSSNSIAEGTKEQSARASQVSTAAQEMSATLGEVVNNISGASDAARDASTAAIKGGDMVMSTVDSMNGIAATAKESSLIITALGSKSDEIGSIINVINDIADQTNLLALNAAIEAARAGEQGRGFAVVADEVRKLAEKTMTATKEIGKMIQGMQVETGKAIASVEHEVNAVDAGVKLASEAGEAISDIVAKVEEVTGMIEQISVASAEQSTVTEQISSDIDSVATVANETASNTVHISEASQDIARLAAGLKSKVEKFRIGKS